MTIANPQVQALFIEPVLTVDIGAAISESQVRFLKNLKMTRNQVNLISENLYIFEEPELLSIKQAIQEALDVYANEIMGISQKLYITQSWSLVNETNVGMHGHSHSNSIVSGSLYYCDLPTPGANMIFNRHDGYQRLEINPEKGKRNLYNSPVNVVVPKKNDLVLFSSALTHSVDTNRSDEPRYSIAFNTFIKGKLGAYRDVSELTL